LDNKKVKEMKLTASQQPVFKQVKDNYECIQDVLDNTKDSDWVLTPEGSLSGYCTGPIHHATKETIDEYTDYLTKIETYLKENQRNIALGTGHIEQDKMPYNEIRFYKQGNLQKYYAKQMLTHGPDFMGEYYYYLPGVRNETVWLDKNTLAGALICNDAWAYPPASPNGNPYHWRKLKELGCRVVFVSANCTMDVLDPIVYNFHESTLRMMAKAFDFHVVVSSACTDMNGEPRDHVQCPSGIIDPTGDWIVKCKDKGMDTASAEIDFG